VADAGTAPSAPIAAKITWAETQLRQYGEQLRADAITAELLERLLPATEACRQAMADTGIVELCATCERDEGGSCCGAGLENRYDGVTLLVNLLLGAELPDRRRDPASCFFLGADGCLLTARDVICVNFICQKIADEVSPQQLGPLREREGIELETLFALHARVAALLGEEADG
jgi:hypothetical protein